MKIADFLQFRKDCSDDRKLTDEDIIEAFDKLEDLIKPNDRPQCDEGVPEWFDKMLQEVWSSTKPPKYRTRADWQKVEAEIARRTAELTAERDQARAEVEKFKTSAVGTLVADAIRVDRESDERECRREIRRLRAEVERLKSGDFSCEEINGFCDGIDYVYDYDARQAVRNERNAREAAEASLAELRELVRTHYLMWTTADASTEWSFLKRMKSCPEDDLDAALAEFRKQKEPAT